MKKLFTFSTRAFFIAILFFFYCKKGTERSNDAEFGNYISAYTSGLISKTSPIKIKLTSDIAEKVKNLNLADFDLFDFSPSIKGQLRWSDNQTIEFVPEHDLPSNTTFQAEFLLKNLTEVPKKLKIFKFDFQTIKQNFDITINEIITTDKKTLKWQKVTGILQTADLVKTLDIEKVLKANQGPVTLKIVWHSDASGLEHLFEIDSIKRVENAGSIVINWDGTPIGADKKGEQKIEIPAIGDFKFISAKIVHKPETYLQVQFSDPLIGNQDLSGLVTIQNVNNLKYVIEDNIVKVYPQESLKGTYKVFIYQGIKNVLGYKLNKNGEADITFEEIKPGVRLISKGVILPTSDKGLVYPFEAVNLKGVDVKIVKIFDNNVQQFLQINELDGSNQLKRVGRVVLNKTIKLEGANIIDFGRWNRYTLDLSKLISKDLGAIYRISISFKPSYSLYNCGDSVSTNKEMTGINESENIEEDIEDENWNGGEDYYEYENYNYYGDNYWENRDNPCHPAYFNNNRWISQNIFASNLGLIAKMGNDQKLKVFVTDLLTTKPISGVEVKVLNYQQQEIQKSKTNGDGIAEFENLKNGFFVLAEYESQKGYLKINNGNSLSLSQFDVSGVSINKGLKGFIYGERGVWRPGDTIFLTFILKEENQPLPENHPIVMELRNPSYQLVKREVQKKNQSGFYTFVFKTSDDSPTGNWEASIKVGGASFVKKLKIETVKPNRLKIKLDFPKEFIVKGDPLTARLNATWLHGAVARDMKVTVDAVLNTTKTTFKKFENYHFDDPSKSFNSELKTVFEGTTDENGNTTVNADLNSEFNAPGKLMVSFITKVFEKSGNFSISYNSIPYFPYRSFVGIKLPEGDKYSGMLVTDTFHSVDIAVVNPRGEIVNDNRNIDIQLYKMEWRWWWDNSNNEIANYTQNSYTRPIKTAKVQASNGRARWNFKINYPDWGRFLIKAYDPVSGHSCAQTIYIDWPSWQQQQDKDRSKGATMLVFTSDKEKYNTGEDINLKIPTGNNSRALISIENGTKIINTYWLEAKAGTTEFKFKATKEMTPNIFVHITLIQPHAQTANDLPIRLYGVIPVLVESPETHLEPLLSMPEELESEKPVQITVSEKNNKKMTYTIAMVDEGLLDLTNFKTPDPWNEFFAREALGVRTWDLYNFVIGAFGGELERLLSIGGDQAITGDKGRKAMRFKPMVKFLGPFTLEGGKQTHTIQMPQYIGSVRTMLIAGYDGAFGTVDKTTAVKKPLMILGTLPRVLGPGESVKLPITVFAMDKNIKNVTVKVKTNKYLIFEGPSEKTIIFTKPDEQTIFFDLKVASLIGIAKVEIEASSSGEKAKHEIELDVRNPNPPVTNIFSKMLQSGELWDTELMPAGVEGTNKGTLEVSSIPPLNLAKRLNYLIQYPHGCIEQTTSSVFPQLYLPDIMELNSAQKQEIERNIKAAIDRLTSFQAANGGFNYWPGYYDVNEWGTNYAGHFLVEAKKKGYSVPVSMLKGWIKYQKQASSNWYDNGPHSQLEQAYRLYTLSIADEADNSSMNRLREQQKLSIAAKWRLSAAYQVAGKAKIAQIIITNLPMNVPQYNELGYTFGSDLRDKAMILETLSLMDKKTEAYGLLKEVSEKLASENWYSTQTTAYSLLAIAGYVGKNAVSSQLNYSFTFNGGKSLEVVSKSPVSQNDLKFTSATNKNLLVKNNGQGVLFIRAILEGVPEIGNENDSENNLRMNISYNTIDGSPVDIENIEQGTDFIAEVTIVNPGIRGDYQQIALTQIFPSGWEIINTRMMGINTTEKADIPSYQDIRDDRVYTYFDLGSNRSKKFRIVLNASYLGKFYMPTVYSEAMYDASINARKHGKWVEIVEPGK